MKKPILFILLLFVSWSAVAQTSLEEMELRDIFFEPHLPGVRPSNPTFSADMRHIYFSWNDSAYAQTGIYQVDLNGRNLKKAEETGNRFFTLSPDGRKVAFTRGGNLYIADRDFKNERQVIATQSTDYSPNWSPDGRMLAFLRAGDVWVTDLNSPSIRQVTSKGNNEPNYGIAGWAGNNKLILRQADNSEARTIYFPTYAGDFVTPGASRRGLSEITMSVAWLDSNRVEVLSKEKERSSLSTSPSGKFVAVDYADHALKHRQIRVYDLYNRSMNVVFEDSTEGWLHDRTMMFAPESDVIMFQSEISNWNHIYTINPDGSNMVQHTSGDFDIPWATWLNDQTIVYASTEVDLGERHIYTLNLRNNRINKLTDDEGYRYQFRLSHDNRYVVYAKTYFNDPYDFYILDLQRPRGEVRLTNSVPETFKQTDWQKEEYVHFTGRDGETTLAMSVLKPANFDPSKKYPVVVFVHGAGSLQNVYKGWSNNYWREYMFHQFLNQKGYAVIEVDFRHSTGYGRKFREDVTDWMGRYETEDVVDGLDWVQANGGGYLDLDNVGIYGGSYGGFMALYAISAEPERFHAAAALRAVTNWRNYYYANPGYTLPRLGDPDLVLEHYDRSSPLTYVDETTNPALILHGLIDDNVGFQDAVHYIEALIQAGNKDFEMMMYPTERHGFTAPESWYDEYRRMFEFFEKHLK